jgi:16S rRNA (uracil1498-N3)-methyltransferase
VADRFFCPGLDPTGPAAVLDGDEAHHLSRVLRAGEGTAVELFDGRGRAVSAVVRAVSKTRVELAVGAPLPDRAAAIDLTLAVAPPKGDRFDWLVEKTTEMGVARLVLIGTERSEVEPRDAKLDRLRRRIIEASKQCGRARLMELTGPVALVEFLRSDHGNAVRMIAHPSGSACCRPDGRNAAVAIGPEGGFSDREIDEATRLGWSPIGLGPTVLRVETAALAASSLVLLGPSGPTLPQDERPHA